MPPDTKTMFHSIQILNEVIFDPHTQNESILISELKSSQVRSLTLKSRQYRPPIQKIKSISMLTLKPSDFRPEYKKRDHFHHHLPPKNQANRSSHPKQGNFGPHTVHFDAPHKNQVTFDLSTKPKSNTIPHTIIKFISAPLLKSSKFHPHSKMKSISVPQHKNQGNFVIHTKTKQFSTPTQKPSHFRSLQSSPINSDPYHKIKSSLMPRLQHQLFFDPHTETTSTSIPTLKSSQVRYL